MINRRDFLKKGLKYATLGALGFYSYKAGISGVIEDIWYLANVICPLKKPENKLLFDQHFHIGEFKKDKLEKIVNEFLDTTDFVTIAIHGIHPTKGEDTYEGLVKKIKDYKLARIDFSDKYATIISKEDKRTVLLKGQEVYSLNPNNPKQQIHINTLGIDYIREYITSEELLESVELKDGMATLNHPFSIPNKYVKFWFPNSKEEDYLKKLAQDYDIFIETHNMMNVAWMAAANAKAKLLSQSSKRKGLGGSDAHETSLKHTLNMIGHCGTLLDPSPQIQDLSSLTGKEIIQSLAKYIKNSKIETLDNYASPWTFYNVMVRRPSVWK
jgi:predicted metal-dependent phosphoesterase TrpH